MTTVHINKCPICDSENVAKTFVCKDHYTTKENFEVFQCSACSFIFTQDFPNEKNIGKYYEIEEYISHSNTSKGLTNKLYHWVRESMLKEKYNIIKKHTTTSSRWLLDYGCGIGFFLSFMRRKGWSVKGVEKNIGAREFAQKNFGLFLDDPEKLKEYEELSFGAITLWHSLEHIENLNAILQTLNKLLVENGTVFIAVPNADSADANYYKEYWAAYDVPRHLWHFTYRTMKTLVNNNGFDIQAYYPMPFDAFYVSILSERYKGSKFAFVKGMINGLRFYLKSLNNPKKSSSLIYVLKKDEVINFNLK